MNSATVSFSVQDEARGNDFDRALAMLARCEKGLAEATRLTDRLDATLRGPTPCGTGPSEKAPTPEGYGKKLMADATRIAKQVEALVARLENLHAEFCPKSVVPVTSASMAELRPHTTGTEM